VKLATALRWVGFIGLAVIAIYAWSIRAPTLAQKAERAAMSGGAVSAQFGSPGPGVREDAVCGTVDGKRAVYRERGGLSVDDETVTWAAMHRGWCSA